MFENTLTRQSVIRPVSSGMPSAEQTASAFNEVNLINKASFSSCIYLGFNASRLGRAA